MKYRDIFPSPYSFFVVIHVRDEKQTRENLKISLNAGVDGIFLINHQLLHQELFGIAKAIKECYPNLWLGINCLDLTPHEVFLKVPNFIDGIWVDNAGIEENKEEQPYAGKTLEIQSERDWEGLYFGGGCI
jgi:hypothetical protein